MAKKSNLLETFIGEQIAVFVSGFNLEVVTEDGHPVEVPLVVEGLLLDMDDRFILVGTEDKSQINLVNISNIGKIELVDQNEPELLEKPDRSSMN